jgi:hypothetical protein
MQLIVDTLNLGPITISQHVIKHFSRLCDDDMNKASEMAAGILRSLEIERLDVPAAIASLMNSNGDDPNALEFWVHFASCTMFLVKPHESIRLVEMAMKQNMVGCIFDKD